MKTVILCGGKGTRLNELGKVVPKALIEIGGRPIIWHLMRRYAYFGFTEFSLCLGHLGDRIREFFGAEQDRTIIYEDTEASPWRVSLHETGESTNTGGRIGRIRDLLLNEERFFVTYGDGLADIDLKALLDLHSGHGKAATLTVVRPRSPFGLVELDGTGMVARFSEKPKLDVWINGGFFVFERSVLDLLSDDQVLEEAPLETLAANGELMAFRHDGFWKCMDTYKDSLEFNELWNHDAPWKV